MFKLSRENVIEARKAEYVEVVCAPEQVHGKDQAHQSQVVVAMQMGNKYMADAVKIFLVAQQLHLSAFTAVDEEVPVLNFQELRGRKSPVSRQCATRAENGYVKAQGRLVWSLKFGV